MVSSAYLIVLKHVWSASSATYKLNCAGLSIRACGTSENIGNRVDLLSSICTCWLLPICTNRGQEINPITYVQLGNYKQIPQ